MAEGVEAIVRHAYEQLWNDGDIEALIALADEDIRFRTSGAFPDLEQEYRGHDGIRLYWRTIQGSFDQLSIEVARVIENGEDVLVLFRFRARGREGLELDAGFGQIAKWRGGRVHELIAFPDWKSAADAADVVLEDAA